MRRCVYSASESEVVCSRLNRITKDQPAQLHCNACNDDYCEVCFAAQHRKGNRKGHTSIPLPDADPARAGPSRTNGAQSQESQVDKLCVFPSVFSDSAKMDVQAPDSDDEEEATTSLPTSTTNGVQILGPAPAPGTPVGEWFVDRAKYIPVRLTLTERKYLRLLEAALQVSEYTDKIDVYGFGLAKTKRIVAQIRELCAIMSGLMVSADYKLGQELFADRDFQANAEFYQSIFELGRRHKIMNPDKMRSTYGKLIYVLQVGSVTSVLTDVLTVAVILGQSVIRR